MEWQQLEYFRTVARLQHFTRAAEELFISQPALSRSIARLEKELGVPLFERQGRSVRLNRYGKMFLIQVNAALQKIEEGKQELLDAVSPNRGCISLAFLHTLGIHFVPDLLGLFRRDYPKITFQLFQNATIHLWEQLKEGDIDLCLSSPPITQKEGIVWEKLLSEELFVIAPHQHRLARQSEIRLKEIAGESFIGFKEGFGLRALTDELCEEAGFTPKVSFEGEEVATVAGLVSAGLGVGLIPEIRGIDTEKLSVLRVTDRNCHRDIGLGWIDGRYLSPAAKQFRRFVMDYFNGTKQ